MSTIRVYLKLLRLFWMQATLIIVLIILATQGIAHVIVRFPELAAVIAGGVGRTIFEKFCRRKILEGNVRVDEEVKKWAESSNLKARYVVLNDGSILRNRGSMCDPGYISVIGNDGSRFSVQISEIQEWIP